MCIRDRLETNLYYLPDNENNLGYRAAKLLMDEFGVTEGVEIKMKKFIPVAAGMAGGSSDAAAVPVSYTHLDVYKRQMQKRAADSRPIIRSRTKR